MSITGRLCRSGCPTRYSAQQPAAERLLVISNSHPMCEMKDLSLCFHTKYQLNNRYALVWRGWPLSTYGFPQKSNMSLRKHLSKVVHLFRGWKLHGILIWYFPNRQLLLYSQGSKKKSRLRRALPNIIAQPLGLTGMFCFPPLCSRVAPPAFLSINSSHSAPWHPSEGFSAPASLCRGGSAGCPTLAWEEGFASSLACFEKYHVAGAGARWRYFP